MLDRLVEDFPLQEKMTDARGEPSFIDVERHVAEIAAERRPPHQDGDRHRQRQSDREAVGADQRAPAGGRRPVPGEIDRMDEDEQREEDSGSGQPRAADAGDAEYQRRRQAHLHDAHRADASNPGSHGGTRGGCQYRSG